MGKEHENSLNLKPDYDKLADLNGLLCKEQKKPQRLDFVLKQKTLNSIEKLSFNNYKEIFKDIRQYDKRRLVVADVPELEVCASKHRFEDEQDIPYIRQTVLPVNEYFSQIGKTCGLTSFRLILGALGKKVPSYEDVTGKSVDEIKGTWEREHNRFLDRSKDFLDVKVTNVRIHGVKEQKELVREEIFSLLGEGQYLYVPINWMKLHGRWHPEGRKDNDHAIVVHGARETAAPIEGAKVNFLITDPNSVRYHNIWIPENLLYQAFARDYADISAYKLEAPTLKERVKKRFTGKRPVGWRNVVPSPAR